jgi:hypothetical protein
VLDGSRDGVRSGLGCVHELDRDHHRRDDDPMRLGRDRRLRLAQRRRSVLRRAPVPSLNEGALMRQQFTDSLLALLGLVGFAVLMALRTQAATFGARVAVAALAGACLGAALISIQRARRRPQRR